jgi:hypothetical protein
MSTLPDPSPQGRTLSQLNEAERYAAYDRLQESMPDVWSAMGHDFDDESVVVVPSISLERSTATSGTLVQAYEERALFLLLLLRQPRLRMVFVTSLPVSEAVVAYYLGLLPGVIPSHARARLTLVSVGDAGPAPLSEKLLARPRLLREIRAMVRNPARCHLVPYNTTTLERDLAVSLGIPMYGSDPRLSDLGTKTGCRRIFQELGVRCPVGPTASGRSTSSSRPSRTCGVTDRRSPRRSSSSTTACPARATHWSTCTTCHPGHRRTRRRPSGSECVP